MRGRTERGAFSRRGSGFTLVELLVGIAIVFVLTGVSLLGVRASLEAGREARSLGNLRTHGQVFTAYTGDADQMWPMFEDPGRWRSASASEAGSLPNFFGRQTRLWPRRMMRAGYYTSEVMDASFYTPRAWSDLEGFSAGQTTSYLYGAAFLARPEYWREATRTGVRQWGPTRITDVPFSSQKALHNHRVFRVFGAGEQTDTRFLNSVHLSFVDGSSAAFSLGEILEGYPGGPGRFGGWNMLDPYAVASYTIDGVRGRDVEGR